jgi:predicted ATP-dependent endonuclease of OLD family
LHPNQQENMAYQLRTLSKLSDHQVFITSHSPNFLDKAHENLLEIIRVKKILVLLVFINRLKKF